MNTLLVLVFVLTILLCLATYALYPLVLLVAGRLFPFATRKEDITPPVSILIAAYNEEKDIRQKIENTLAMDYPCKNLEIIIGSDGSSDRTTDIARSFEKQGVRLLDFKRNRGKTSVQNDMVAAARHDILVFTDAASFLPADALRRLVRAFADERVGGVAGRMDFVDTDLNLTTQSQGLYWKYELKLRVLESRLGCLIGVDGPLYAVRRDCYIPLASHIISDLMTPLLVLDKGKRVILEERAHVYEVPTAKTAQELKTRRRITLRGLIGLFAYPRLLSPYRRPLLAVQIFLHKLLRWAVGPLVILNLITCFFLAGMPFFRLFLILHLFFYLGAFFGWVWERTGRPLSWLRIPYYFCLVNIAATLGIVDFLNKKTATSWTPVRTGKN